MILLYYVGCGSRRRDARPAIDYNARIGMKLIIVKRTKPETYERLKSQFADDLNVQVVWERRARERRRTTGNRGPERRSRDRRKFMKSFNGKDFIVIYITG